MNCGPSIAPRPISISTAVPIPSLAIPLVVADRKPITIDLTPLRPRSVTSVVTTIRTPIPVLPPRVVIISVAPCLQPAPIPVVIATHVGRVLIDAAAARPGIRRVVWIVGILPTLCVNRAARGREEESKEDCRRAPRQARSLMTRHGDAPKAGDDAQCKPRATALSHEFHGQTRASVPRNGCFPGSVLRFTVPRPGHARRRACACRG
jgi:hypothetical protein